MAAQNVSAGPGPARLGATVRDIALMANGSPQPRGILTSSGTAVNNLTTAVPFNAPAATGAAAGTVTLAGKMLLVHATAAGFVLPATSSDINIPTATTVATTSTIPPVAATFPGVPIAAGEVKSLTMLPGEGYLQFISASGTASLVVLELL